MKCLVLVLLALSIAGPWFPAQAIPVPPPYRPTAVDALRARAQSARLEENWAEAEAALRILLQQNPGDGFALREVWLMARDRDRLAELLETLDSPDPDPLPGARLAPSDLSFIRGLAAFHTSRHVSALREFERALEARPGWGWGRLYRARVLAWLARPTAEVEREFRLALEDPDAVAPTLVAWMDRAQLLDGGRWPPNAEATTAWLRTVPWARTDAEWLDLDRRFSAMRGNRADFERAWRETQSQLGPLAMALIDRVGRYVSRDLPPADALEFLAARERDGPGAREWRLARVEQYWRLGMTCRADSLARDAPPEMISLAVRLEHAMEASPPQECLELVDRLIMASRDRWTLELTRLTAMDFGDSSRAARMVEYAGGEDPLGVLRHRIESSFQRNLSETRALLDSLAKVGAEVPELSHYRLQLREALGDTVSAGELDAFGPAVLGSVIERLAAMALTNGRPDRARRLWAQAAHRWAPTVWGLFELLQHFSGTEGKELALAMTERLLAQAAGFPRAETTALRVWTAYDEDARAAARIQGLAGVPSTEARFLVELATYADHVGRPGLADTLLGRVEALEPGRRDARLSRGWILIRRGEREGARAQLEPIIREMPGRSFPKTLLSAVEGTPQQGMTPDPEGPGSALAAGEEDLHATDWILARAAAADTVRNVPAVYLTHRRTFQCDRLDAYDLRQRTVVRVNDDAGVEQYRTIAIPFDVSDGAPRVRVARVIHPDGLVVLVSPADMVITTAQDAGTDVSEARTLVIPIPDLRPGALVDVAYDGTYRSSYGARWSWFALMAHEAPALESWVEARVRRGLHVSLLGSPEGPQAEISDEGEYVRSRWTVRNLPVTLLEDSPADLFDALPWVAASTYESWEAATDLYRSAFWKQVESSSEVQNLARRLTGNATDASQKLAALYGHCTVRVNYLAIELGAGRVVPNRASEVLRRGYGDCKDKAALLIALCEAVGIEARPVLVTFAGRRQPRPDFVDLGVFSHMIVWVPGVDGGVFCDPTSGSRCPEDLPASVAGGLGLTFGRTGAGTLVRITPPVAARHGTHMTIDLRPLQEKDEALITVVGRYRGDPARAVERLLAQSDTAEVQRAVDRLLAYGLWESCRRERWAVEGRGCGTITLSATYRDERWSNFDSEVKFTLRTEVADPLMSYPRPEGRRFGVRIAHPFADTVVLRLHAVPNWEPVEEIASLPVQAATYSGTVESTRRAEAADRWLEVLQRFEVREHVFTPEQWRIFHRDWLRFLAGVYQPYQYRRSLDAAQMARLEAYAREHPEDTGFALQAASQMLGGDVGGAGTVGAERRALAGRLLTPLLRARGLGPLPYQLLAAIAMREGRYRSADSLIGRARRAYKSDLTLLATQLLIKGSLGDPDATVATLKELQQRLGGDEIQLALVSKLYELGRLDEARSAEKRYYSLSQQPETTAVLRARFAGLIEAHRCEAAASAWAELSARIGATSQSLAEATLYLKCGPLRRAVRIYEDLWIGNPLNSGYSNNLAWLYARLGENLDRAEELANASRILSSDPVAVRNTLAVILARGGRWKEARASFQALVGEDDRPEHQIVNLFFVGLCDWQEGRTAEARKLWKSLLERRPDAEWRSIIERALALAAQGQPPEQSIFVSEPAAP